MRRLVRSGDGRAVKDAVAIPVDVVNEQALISAALQDRDVRNQQADRIVPDLFSADGHAQLWQAVVEMRKQDLDFTPEIIHRLTGSEQLADYCSRLVDDRRGPPANLRHHVELLYWDRGRIEVARGPLPKFLKAIQDPTFPPESLRKLADEIASSLRVRGGFRRYIRDPNLLATQAKAYYGFRVPYGIEGFDDYEDGAPRLVAGAAPGLVTVITALSGGGKSQFCRALALAQAAMGRRVAYGAWEMGSAQTLALMACGTLGLNRTALVAGGFTAQEKRDHEEEIDRLKDLIRFFDLPSLRARGEQRKNEEILDDVHGMLLEFGCEIAIFDLWHKAFQFRSESEESAALTRQQAIGQETGVHLALVHQQRLKDVELRDDPSPTREGNKGSSAWVDIADTMIGVHLPHLFKPVPANTCEFPILKQRHGVWPLAMESDYDASTGTFSNVRTVDFKRTHASKLDGWIEAGKSDDQPKRRRRKAA